MSYVSRYYTWSIMTQSRKWALHVRKGQENIFQARKYTFFTHRDSIVNKPNNVSPINIFPNRNIRQKNTRGEIYWNPMTFHNIIPREKRHEEAGRKSCIPVIRKTHTSNFQVCLLDRGDQNPSLSLRWIASSSETQLTASPSSILAWPMAISRDAVAGKNFLVIALLLCHYNGRRFISIDRPTRIVSHESEHSRLSRLANDTCGAKRARCKSSCEKRLVRVDAAIRTLKTRYRGRWARFTTRYAEPDGSFGIRVEGKRSGTSGSKITG